jgi:hypothetical protein
LIIFLTYVVPAVRFRWLTLLSFIDWMTTSCLEAEHTI